MSRPHRLFQDPRSNTATCTKRREPKGKKARDKSEERRGSESKPAIANRRGAPSPGARSTSRGRGHGREHRRSAAGPRKNTALRAACSNRCRRWPGAMPMPADRRDTPIVLLLFFLQKRAEIFVARTSVAEVPAPGGSLFFLSSSACIVSGFSCCCEPATCKLVIAHHPAGGAEHPSANAVVLIRFFLFFPFFTCPKNAT